MVGYHRCHRGERAHRLVWGEDGLLGISDRDGNLCFAVLKERLFGLSGPEGDHGEDVKEYYFFLDGTPTHSYMKALYKYPQRAYPYAELVAESRRRCISFPPCWFCNTWAWGVDDRRPVLEAAHPDRTAGGTAGAIVWIRAEHHALGEYWLPCDGAPPVLFTENETNAQRLASAI